MYNGTDKYGGVVVGADEAVDSAEIDIEEVLATSTAEETVVLQGQSDDGPYDVLLSAHIDPKV